MTVIKFLFLFPLLFAFLSVLFFREKGAFLIAGYNTASKKEKENYEKKALFRFMGKMMLVLAGSNSLMVVGIVFEIYWLEMVGIVLFLLSCLFAIIYANTGSRFRKI